MDELIRAGLLASEKRLHSSLLYDDLGSTLFEAITHLAEYEVARADTALLHAHRGEALSMLAGPVEIVELGPGHGRKARLLIEGLGTLQPRTHFVAVDVSASALAACQRHVEQLANVDVSTVEATFIEGLCRAPRRAARRLVAFLGSNLSNFDRRDSLQFLRDVRNTLLPGDTLLLSADLEKPAWRLLPAYDDALGVTAAFNRNLLQRLDREYGANFELSGFAHEVRWNAPHRRIEMHLRSLRKQRVIVPRLEIEIDFAEDETIWTESSHRFSIDELYAWGAEARLECTKTWVDRDWPLALVLFTAI